MAASYQDTAPTAPVPEKASLFEDFIDIFYAPSKVFARRANSGFLLIFIVVCVLMAVLAFAVSGSLEAALEVEVAKSMAEQTANMTEDQAAGARRMGLMMAKGVLYMLTPIIILLFGLIVWLVSKMFGAALTYGQSAMIVAYAQIPRIVGSIVMLIQGLILEPAPGAGMAALTLSPARFMDPATTSNGMMQLMLRFDLFVLWVTLLLGIGIAVVGKVSREKGYMAAAVLWLLGSLPALMVLASGK